MESFVNKIAGHPLAQNEKCLHMFLTEPTIGMCSYFTSSAIGCNFIKGLRNTIHRFNFDLLLFTDTDIPIAFQTRTTLPVKLGLTEGGLEVRAGKVKIMLFLGCPFSNVTAEKPYLVVCNSRGYFLLGSKS